jgi:hypothetical protein
VTYPQIGAFARLANGNAPKTRSIAGQATKLGRDAHDVFYDEVNDEIVVAGAFGQAVLTYRGGANGEEPPIRVIQGPKTQIQMPGYGAYVDAVHNEIFIVEGRDRPGEEYILVFPRTATGDVAPIRVIKGPDTMLKNARSMAVDPIRNLIAVTSNNGMLIFNRTDNGNVKPRAIIKGPGGNFRLLESKGYIVAAGGGGGGGDGDDEDGGARRAGEARGGRGGGNAEARPRAGSVIRVWSITDNGNPPPLFELRNPNPGPGGGGNRVALNPKEKEVVLGGAGTPESVEIFSFPEIFD